MADSKVVVGIITAWFFIGSGLMDMSPVLHAGERDYFCVGGYSPEHSFDEYGVRHGRHVFYPSLFNAHPYYRYHESPRYRYDPRGRFMHYWFSYDDSRREEVSPYKNLKIRPAGELQILAKPPQARVLVDGYEAEADDDHSWTMGLLTGVHVVEVRAEGYQSYVQEVEIETAQKKVLLVELVR
ncbi:MAG: hypothetical protein JXD19_09135 [Deltaproteobacteria bacterium]|nr:hypothetical protein [Deltaproteobacteria bacterium]